MLNPLFLKIFYQGKLLKVRPFTEEQISIGSGEGLSLTLRGLAPWHVLIEKKQNGYIAFDLGSDAGTLVDGRRIEGECALRSGSFLTLGEYQIQFFTELPPKGPIPTVSGTPSVKSSLKSSAGSVITEGNTARKSSPPSYDYAEERYEWKDEEETGKTKDAETEDAPLLSLKKNSADKKEKEKLPSFIEKQASSPSKRSSPSDLNEKRTSPSFVEKQAPPFSKQPSPTDLRERQASPPSAEKQASYFSGKPSPENLNERPPSAVAFQKPEGKGFWRTFAPPGKIKSLDEFLEPSIGNFIEVIVAWKERILSVHHFSKGSAHIGSSEECEIPVTNLLGLKKYKVLDIRGSAQIFFNQEVTGALFQGKDKTTRTRHPVEGGQSVTLKPYEMVRLDFKDALRVYARLTNKPSAPALSGLFKFSLAEISVLFFSFLLTGLLVFYGGLYAPLFLKADEKFVEENIRKAVVKFNKPPAAVDYKMAKKTRKKKTAFKMKKKKISKIRKKVNIPSKVKTKSKPKKMSLKTLRKKGTSVPSTRGKKSKKVAVGSIRPGGSLKTGKAGTSAKTKAPDPTKKGLLGVFGSGGKLKSLDQGATGSAGGGLLGLAEGASGFAGTKESYSGEGVGTRTKELGSGGEGSALVGISGIKTKGRGGAVSAGLGNRGRMSIDIGTDDIDVEGEIDRAAILRVLRKNHRQFDHCYQFSLQGDNALQGPLKMQWNIQARGNVTSARAVHDGVGSAQLTHCVANVLKRLRFPTPPSGQIPRISFKFVFSK